MGMRDDRWSTPAGAVKKAPRGKSHRVCVITKINKIAMEKYFVLMTGVLVLPLAAVARLGGKNLQPKI